MNFWTSLGSALVLSIVAQMVGAVDGVDESRVENSYTLGRNRVPPSDSSFERRLTSEKGMGDIWDKASRVARSEIEVLRLLRSPDMMSMSLSSSNDSNDRPPIPGPSPSPIMGPTPAPNPDPTPAPESGPSPAPQPDFNPAQPPSYVDCVQGRPRKDYIFDLLVPITQSETLLDPTTPQGKAYEYLATYDPGLTDHCSSSTIEQRYGLTTFFYALNGDDWNDRSGWLEEEQECSWFGVDCDDSDDSLFVTRLLLRK